MSSTDHPVNALLARRGRVLCGGYSSCGRMDTVWEYTAKG